jgi:hypothetical protein
MMFQGDDNYITPLYRFYDFLTALDMVFDRGLKHDTYVLIYDAGFHVRQPNLTWDGKHLVKDRGGWHNPIDPHDIITRLEFRNLPIGGRIVDPGGFYYDAQIRESWPKSDRILCGYAENMQVLVPVYKK